MKNLITNQAYLHAHFDFYLFREKVAQRHKLLIRTQSKSSIEPFLKR